MPYTRRRFDPIAHACGPFLGREVALPEIHQGFHPRLVRALETPVVSIAAAAEFAECMAFGWLNGMDDKLAPAHWGVAWARCLEGMFWRLQDLLVKGPMFGLKMTDALSFFSDDEPAKGALLQCKNISVSCAGGTFNLGRDLALRIHLSQQVVFKGEDYIAYRPGQDIRAKLLPHPLPERGGEDDIVYGSKVLEAFWAPFDLAMVVTALEAWRGGAAPAAWTVRPLSSFGGSVEQAMGASFGPGCASGVRAYMLNQNLSLAPSLSVSASGRPRF